MKTAFALLGWLCLLPAAPVHGQNATAGKDGRSVIVEENGTRLTITCLDPRIVHIEARPETASDVRKSLVVDDRDFPFDGFRVKRSRNKIVVRTSRLAVEYDRISKRILFRDRTTGDTILAEHSRAVVAGGPDGGYRIVQRFALTPDEAIYGLGQYQDGAFDYRGRTVNLVQANREIASPVLLSTRRYALYWDNYSKTTFTEKRGVAAFDSEIGDGADYYFIYGSDMNDAVAGVRRLTGEVPMQPKSAFGFWMSKERYRSFDELTGVVAEYRKRGIPLDNIVQDWQYWGEDMDSWNGMVFDTTRFPRPEEAIDRLHREYRVKLTVSVWPGVGKKTAVYRAMDSVGALFDVPTWAGYKVIDIYDTAAQKLFWRYLDNGLRSKGVDAWWMDATEPSFRDGLYQDRQEYWSKSAGMTAIGPFARYLNTYSLVLSRMMYERLREQSDKRVSVLTRSAFAGQQKYGTSTWSGDIYASWDVFRKQIPAGLNLCMTGFPYWTTDIGGFRVVSRETGGKAGAGEIGDYRNAEATSDGGYEKGLQDSAYLELYTRWFQFGAFCPLFRAHGTEVPREIWHFGEPGGRYYDAQLQMIALRYSLLPYIYSAAWQVTAAGGTMMRPLVMDFTDDPRTFAEAGSYLFGESLLVHPVTRPMFHDRNGRIGTPDTTVPVYLPRHAGGYWFDLQSDACYPAGDTVRYEAPLHTIPVFVRGGAIVPRSEPAQDANAADNRKLEISVYTGADARFTLYEDDNETYDYENGIYRAVDLTWNERSGTLTVSDAQGSFRPAYDRQTFTIRIVSPGPDGKAEIMRRKVDYTGKELKIKFRKPNYIR